MGKKPIEVECVIDTKMTLILLMDGDVLDEYGGDYGALRDALPADFVRRSRNLWLAIR